MTLHLTSSEITAILQALSEHPSDEVGRLMRKIVEQRDKQIVERNSNGWI